MMAEKREHGKEDKLKPSESQPSAPDSAEPELSESLESVAPSSDAPDEPGGGLQASSDEEPRPSPAGDSDAPDPQAKGAGPTAPGSDEQDPIQAEDSLGDLVSAIDAEVGAQAFEEVTTADEAVRARQRDFKDDHVVFSLLGTSYAVPIGQVTDLEKLPALTTVPHVPDFVLGVANLRGDIIAVLDLRTFLGFEQSERLDQGRVLIVRVGEDQTTSGLMVDEVQGIRSIPGGDIGAPAAPLEDKVSGLLMLIAEAASGSLDPLNGDGLYLGLDVCQWKARYAAGEAAAILKTSFPLCGLGPDCKPALRMESRKSGQLSLPQSHVGSVDLAEK